MKKPDASALDFEAPITITLTGPLAAVLRFRAYLDEAKPEDVAMQSVATSMLADLTCGFGCTDESAGKLLGVVE